MKQYLNWRPSFNNGYFYLGLAATLVNIIIGVVFKLGLAGVASLLVITIPTIFIGTRIYHQIWKKLHELLDGTLPLDEVSFSSKR